MSDETSDIALPDTVRFGCTSAPVPKRTNDHLQFALKHWIAVADTLKQQRDQAEKERDALRQELDAILTKRSQIVSVGAILEEVATIRAEKDALRKVDEAAKAWRSAWLIATRIGGKEAVVLLESRCIALDEAVAERVVQPTTGAAMEAKP